MKAANCTFDAITAIVTDGHECGILAGYTRWFHLPVCYY